MATTTPPGGPESGVRGPAATHTGGLEEERTPLLDEAGRRMLERLREHPEAPRWTYAVGDRLEAEDLPALGRFRQELAAPCEPCRPAVPPARLLGALAAAVATVPRYRATVPGGLDLERDWAQVPTTCRADLAAEPWSFVPDGEPLDRLVIYRTAGTTGHPIAVPHHPRAVACYLPLVEHALARHGVALDPDPEVVICALLSFQVRTYTYSTVLSAWAGAGFVKVNLRASDWPSPGSPARYLAALRPQLVTGEPVAFAELAATDVDLHPRALVSTSLALSERLRARLADRFSCPVLNWYSAVETGPVACSCPAGELHVLPHDLHVEVVRPSGSPALPGERGEVTVSGGRNPVLPLLRYRTGDFASMAYAPCRCGDPTPRLQGLAGREPVLFRADDGTPVGAVDISRALRELPILRHAFVQRRDRSCELRVEPRPDAAPPDPDALARALRAILGGPPLTIAVEERLDPELPAFTSELPWEW